MNTTNNTSDNLDFTAFRTTLGAYLGPKVEIFRAEPGNPQFAPESAAWFKEFPNPVKHVVCVPCGSSSGNLCALMVRKADQATIAQILKLHPSLPQAPQTVWRGCLTFWVRLSDYQPPNGKFMGMTWISDGLIPIADINENLISNCFLHPGTGTPTSKFTELSQCTSNGIGDFFFIHRLRLQYGNITTKNQSGKYELNPNFLAHYIAAKAVLSYDSYRAEFISTVKTSPGVVSLEKMTLLVHNTAQSFVTLGWLSVKRIKPGAIKSVLSVLKIICARITIGDRDGVIQFAQEEVVGQPDSSVTSAEMYGRYELWCRAKSVNGLPRREFERFIAEVLRREFRVAKSHCVMREAPSGKLTARNGYFGIMFRDDAAAKPTGTQEAEEGPDGKGG